MKVIFFGFIICFFLFAPVFVLTNLDIISPERAFAIRLSEDVHTCWLCDSDTPDITGPKICYPTIYMQPPENGKNCVVVNCLDMSCGYISYAPPAPDPIKLKLAVPIPGLEEFSEGEGVEVNSQTIVKYIGGLYKYLIGIAAILAVLVISFGGVLWVFSGGSADKVGKAKELILGAVVGLVLALASYLILYTINPALVNYKGLKVPYVTKYVDVSEYASDNQTCPSDSYVMKIPDYPGLVIILAEVSDPRLLPETINKLSKATTFLDRDRKERLVIKSAYRDSSLQAHLYNCYRTAKDNNLPLGECPQGCSSCNTASKPNCATSPHQTGKAIDVCLQNGPNGVDTCQYIREDCNRGLCVKGEQAQANLAADQIRLQEIMKQAGFSRYCGEWWHFESSQMSEPCEPGFYPIL